MGKSEGAMVACFLAACLLLLACIGLPALVCWWFGFWPPPEPVVVALTAPPDPRAVSVARLERLQVFSQGHRIDVYPCPRGSSYDRPAGWRGGVAEGGVACYVRGDSIREVAWLTRLEDGRWESWRYAPGWVVEVGKVLDGMAQR